ncbi:MAG: hypothetical protein JWM98_3072, partial [Thermoleophilia bacterium]|nr:hypothetical protein [Thermoleophilia bacterium]
MGSAGEGGIAETAPPASTAEPEAAATEDAIGASGPPALVVAAEVAAGAAGA